MATVGYLECMIVDDDGKPIEMPLKEQPARQLPSAFGTLAANMEKIQGDAAKRTEAMMEMGRQAQRLSQSPTFDMSALAASIKPRPEIGLLRNLLESQTEENAAVANMAGGIEKLAKHAEAEAARGLQEAKRTRWIIGLTVTVVILTGGLVVLTLEILSRTPLHH
jgi:hypothetical protein